MIRGWSSLSLLGFSLAIVHCGPSGSSQDASDAAVDAAAPSDVARADAGPGRAGQECMDDTMCPGLTCDTEVRGGACTGPCMNGTRAAEQAACGGTSGTCLTAGDGAEAESFCAAACRTNTSNSGCRAGFICTGFWSSHTGGTPDSPGCVPFCANDSQCPMGQRCNPRVGECSTMAPNATGLADGSPCRIPAMGQPDPCRGVCFTVVDRNPMGICGTIVDITRTMACPDNPMDIEPLGPQMGDNIAYCLFRRCSETQCCGAGTVCEGADGEGVCTIDDPMEPNIACGAGADAGAPDAARPDAAADAAAADAAVDARPDAAVGGG